MAQIVLTPRFRDDLDRVFGFLFDHSPQSALARIEEIVAALQLLTSSPLIGRPAADNLRELVISVGTGGNVALYAYSADEDLVRVVALRSQRERGYRPPGYRPPY